MWSDAGTMKAAHLYRKSIDWENYIIQLILQKYIIWKDQPTSVFVKM